METNVAFGLWVEKRRKALDLTRDELAQKIGCSPSALRKIESDERRPSKQLAQLLASALNIPADEHPIFIRIARGETSIERLKISPLPSTPSLLQPPQIFPNPIPLPPTPLIGRENELAALRQMLNDSQCRLISLVGPGGSGKTRLAIEVAREQRDSAVFVLLASVNSASLIVPAIADALGFTFYGVANPKKQLLNYLREKHWLLVLDNMEHLLDGADLIAEISRSAPGIKILCTSREPFNLRGEWVFEVGGLNFHKGEELERAGSYSANDLFAQCAQRTKAGLVLTAEDLPMVTRICALVEGMPLAIELAAAWVRTLSCGEIAREIERSLDILVSSTRDMPERHHSMRAVFDHSWNLLSEEERCALARLSVFRGGFTREAADQILGTSLTLISALVTKSLVHRNESGRYDLHELIRQCAADRLTDQAKVKKEAQERHARYYMKYFGDQQDRLQNFEQRQAIQELSGEMDNFRVAWDWSIAHGEFALIESTLRAFATYFDARGLVREGLNLLAHAQNALEKASAKRINQITLAHILVNEGLFSFRLGRLDQAHAVLTRSMDIVRPLNESRVLVEAVSFLGIVLAMMGKHKEAHQLFYEGLELSRATNNLWFEALNLTQIAYSDEQLQDALRAWRAIKDPRFIAFGLTVLSVGMLRLGRYAEARAALEESIPLNESVGDRWGLGSAYRGLGLVEQGQGRHDEAIKAFQKSCSVFVDLGDRWHEARVIGDMGRSVFAMGGLADAEALWCESIRISSEVQGTLLILEALRGVADIRAKQGEILLAYALLMMVLNHPATLQETRTRAEALHAELERQLTPSQIEAAHSQIHAQTFEVFVRDLLEEK